MVLYKAIIYRSLLVGKDTPLLLNVKQLDIDNS